MIKKIVLWFKKWLEKRRTIARGERWSDRLQMSKDSPPYVHSPLWQEKVVEEDDNSVVIQCTSPDGEISRSRIYKHPTFS